MDRTVTRTQAMKSVMVWAACTASEKSPLVFMEDSIKINKERYVRDILDAVCCSGPPSTSGKKKWSFQQDSASNHEAKFT